MSDLTPREKEIVILLAEGSSHKGVAQTLCISIKTVQMHKKNIKTKLGTTNVALTTRYSIRKGWIEP